MRLVTTTLISIIFASTAACGGDSLPERFCDRGEECNLLGPQSKDECVDEGETLLDMLSDAEREAVVELIEGCLELESCAEFEACTNG
jgi:hypothetical protein